MEYHIVKKSIKNLTLLDDSFQETESLNLAELLTKETFVGVCRD
jgi:hypothetical protein